MNRLEFTGIHAEILADETPELDVEGARMSGKSWVCAAKVHDSCVKYPGIWWLICRYSGTETDNQLRPLFMEICRRRGTEPAWHDDESAYWFPEKNGLVSKVFAYGLKTQARDQRYAKIRGSGVAGLWNDQTEEMPEDIGTELRALIRQPGYPHQLIFSPNPPDEESFIADQFPDHGDEKPGRKYYHLSLYDNRHHLPADTIDKMEKAYPPTHAKFKALILGIRGPNITGTPVYDQVFARAQHRARLDYNPSALLLEALDVGKHHPVWVAAQRTSLGAMHVLGGIIGKRMFLEDFLPLVHQYRAEWFPDAHVRTCTDPPSAEDAGAGIRYTHIQTIRDLGFQPKWRENAHAPDVRESVIQSIASMMRRRVGGREEAFVLNDDDTRWLMISGAATKYTHLMVDGCEASYVWDEHFVSVGNKKVRQPKTDQWIDGWQRCLENLALNFFIGQASEADRADRRLRQQQGTATGDIVGVSGPNAWLAW
jgi:hypothetical protein